MKKYFSIFSQNDLCVEPNAMTLYVQYECMDHRCLPMDLQDTTDVCIKRLKLVKVMVEECVKNNSTIDKNVGDEIITVSYSKTDGYKIIFYGPFKLGTGQTKVYSFERTFNELEMKLLLQEISLASQYLVSVTIEELKEKLDGLLN